MKGLPSILLFGFFILPLSALVIYAFMRAPHKPSLQPKDPQSYVIYNNKVFYRTVMQVNEGPEVVDDFELKDADIKSFIKLDPYWAKDNDTVFYMGQNVYPKTGTPVADISSITLVEGSVGLFKDSQAVYFVSPYQDKWFYSLVADADPTSFTLLDRFPYAKDKNFVYYLSLPDEVKKIVDVDGPSFSVLGQCAAVEVSRAYYAWDAKSVIVGDKKLEAADRDTFKIVANFDNGPDGMYVAGAYAVDKNNVYKNCGDIVPGGNPKTCSANNLKECE